ncbi:MAG TPA: VOC family protein [Candidatus Saccharimonadales bacterium]|nr:VOC family protein [Candidatus Saccharimonadales bacterium]
MAYTVTKYPQGTFSWTDFFSTDVAKTKSFLENLFGWTSQDMPTEPGKPDYTMFYLDGKVVAGGSPAFDPNMPSLWNNYVTVDSVDEMTAKAEKLGAKITMPAMDVLDAGRMSTIQDPTGAHLSLWQPKKHIGAQIVNTVGAMSWNELYTKDLEKAKQFYTGLFGWTYVIDKENQDYTVIKNNGRSNGGMFPITPEMGSMPPNWMVYFTVKNIEESVAKVKELGGKVYLEPKDIKIGKIAPATDPTGAAFMIIEMSVTPDPWTE